MEIEAGWFWFLIGWWSLNAILTIANIGRKRDPITPLAATITVIISALLIIGMFVWGR